jgi:hypothetical protein
MRKHPSRKRLQRVSIRAERRPEPDWDRFAWALLQHARLVAKQEKKPGKRADNEQQRHDILLT